MNYYELLEVSPSASVEVIKNAYKTLAKKYHPDAYEGDKTFAEEKMKILNEAISVLENEDKRREYNMINGIYQTSENYGYDGENSVNINVDENGEPIFFSYSDEFEEDDRSKKGSFMDAIDDFINNRKTKKNKTSRSKSENLDLNDLAEALNSEYSDDTEDNANIIPDISELPESDNTDDLYDTEDFRTVRLPGKSAKSSAPRWYYIALACLITGSIVMFFLVLGSLNLDNVRDIINRLSGGSPPEETEYTAPMADDTEHTSTGKEDEFKITTDMPVISTESEDFTESPTEPTVPVVIPPPVATPATTTPPIIRTQPPAPTTKPTVEQTTEAITEEMTEKITEKATEEITEMPEDITETTEEQTMPEETVPEETAPEETVAPETESNADEQITEPENIDETVPDTVPETTDDIAATEEH